MHILLSGRYEMAFFFSILDVKTEEFAGEEVIVLFSYHSTCIYLICDLPLRGDLYHLQRDVSDVV